MRSSVPPVGLTLLALALLGVPAGAQDLPGVPAGAQDLDGVPAGAQDLDGDGVPDARDNCPLARNGPAEGAQADRDGDGVGDACECGDADGNGRVDTLDARTAQRCATGSGACTALCDANGDAVCDSTDARLVQRVAVGALAKTDLACAARPRPACDGVPQPGCPGYAALVEHVLSRVAYGGDPWTRERVRALGLEGYLREQLDPDSIPDPEFDARRAVYEDGPFAVWGKPVALLRRQFCGVSDELCTERLSHTRHPNASLAEVKLLRSIHSRRQLEAVLLDFWFNHLNVSGEKHLAFWALQEYEQDALRPHVLDTFENLAVAMTESVAMLDYLDLRESRRGFVNENFGRELLELHTVGKDRTFDEADVQAASVALTGYWVSGDDFRPRYEPLRHDPSVVEMTLEDTEPWRFDGRRGCGGAPGSAFATEGRVLLCLLARHEKTAERLSRKLIGRFVSERPPPELVDRVTRVWLETHGNLYAVTEAILFSPEFLSTAHAREKVKRPSVFVASLVRAVRAGAEGESQIAAQLFNQTREAASFRGIVGDLAAMGEPLFKAAPPTGFPETSAAWASGGGLLVRLNLVHTLLAAIPDPGAHFGVPEGADAHELVGLLEARLAPGALSDATRARIVEFVDRVLPVGQPHDMRVRQAARAVLSSPGFMLH